MAKTECPNAVYTATAMNKTAYAQGTAVRASAASSVSIWVVSRCQQVPDATTIPKFRRQLNDNKLDNKLGEQPLPKVGKGKLPLRHHRRLSGTQPEIPSGWVGGNCSTIRSSCSEPVVMASPTCPTATRSTSRS